MIIIILIVLLIIIGLIVFYVIKNKKGGDDRPPVLPNYLKDKTRGNFLYNPSSQKLYYNYDTDKFLDAGFCNSCQSACQNGIEIQDINTGINCSDPKNSDLCKGVTGGWILQTLYSADEYEQLIAQKVSGTKALTSNDCIALVNANQPPNTGTGSNPVVITPTDEDTLDLMADTLKSGYNDITDFFTKNKQQFIDLAAQVGMAKAISVFSHSFACAAFILPMYFQGQTFQANVFTVFEISKQALNYMLKDSTEAVANEGVQLSGDIAEMSTEEVMADMAGDVAVKFASEIAEETAAEVVLAAEAGPAGLAIDAIMLSVEFWQFVGMGIDMLDPCGFGQTLYQSDITTVSDAMDNAFYNQILAQTGYIPVIFSADMVKEYGFTCSSASDTKNSVSKIINGLTTDDPCSGYNKFLTDAKNNYLNAILTGTNAYGQCVGSYNDQQLANFLNNLLGLTPSDSNYITAQTVLDAKNLSVDQKNLKSFFTRMMDTIDISIADNNVVVALYIQKYWYVVFSIVLIIILIVFLLR